MGKLFKPRKHEGKLDVEMTVRDGLVNLTAKDGHTPIMKIKDQRYKNINEVLDMLNRKL